MWKRRWPIVINSGRLFSSFSLSTLLIIAAGCGSAARTEPVAKLEGTVTIGGKPLPSDAEGSVTFMPTARGEAPPVQAGLAAGHYKAENVPKGQVTATFHISRLTGKMLKASPDDIHPTPERIDLVPEALRAGLKVEVKGDNPRQDFDLK
jgi:hypothetical protein